VRELTKNCAIKHLWIGIRGILSDKNNEHIINIANGMISDRKRIVKGINKRTRGPLEIHFYNAGDMDIWGLKNSDKN